MTENEAKTIDDCLKELKDHRDVYLKRSTPWRIVNRAVRLIEELKLYRAIGTIEEFKALKNKHIGKDNMVISSSDLMTILNSDSEELKQYKEVGTVEEFKALKEKSVAKKPNQVSKAMDKDKYVGLIGRCPNCSSIVAEDNLVCEDCFQVLDWSE